MNCYRNRKEWGSSLCTNLGQSSRYSQWRTIGLWYHSCKSGQTEKWMSTQTHQYLYMLRCSQEECTRKWGDLPGGSVAKTPCSQSRGPQLDLWLGNYIPYAKTKTWHSHISKQKFSFLGSAVVRNLPADAGIARSAGWTPRWERSHLGGDCNPLQYSCLENSNNRGA